MELLFTEEPSNKRSNVWEDYVPIIQTENTYNVYLTEPIDTPPNYDKLCLLLDSVSEGTKIRLHINTPGGHIYSAWQLVHSLKNTKAHVTGVLLGQVASAGTIIAMFCDDLEVDKFLCFMIHNYSGGAQGKAHEIEAQVTFDKKYMPKFFKLIYKDFLTPREMTKVLKGGDIYLSSYDVLERWEAKKRATA